MAKSGNLARAQNLALLLLFVGVSVSARTTDGLAQQCAVQMRQSQQQMAGLALKCGENASLIGSISAGGDGGIPFEMHAKNCSTGRSVSSQLSAFNECSRTYVCAVLAYGYALSNLKSFGGDCTAAANAGLQRFPVK